MWCKAMLKCENKLIFTDLDMEKRYKDAQEYMDAAIEYSSPYLINRCFRIATPYEDMVEATDAKIMPINIAFRNRLKNRSYCNYITLRSVVKYGGRTEIHKIMDGYGDVYIYSWRHPHIPKKLSTIFILDLHIFREGLLKYGIKPNRVDIPNFDKNGIPDGTCFNSYKISDFTKKGLPFIINEHIGDSEADYYYADL